MLDWESRVKIIWGHSMPEIILFINGKLVCLYDFTLVEIMLKSGVEWKTIKGHVQEIKPDF